MGKRPVILVVDDHEPILKLLRVNLSLEGYNVVTASNGISALQLLEEHKPELVILDIMMPGKSGIELLSEIAASCPDTAVVMATALTDAGTAVQCMKQGAYDYITKPFNPDEVVLSVDRALEKRRLELESRNQQRHLEQRVEEQSKKIRASFVNAVASLVYALEAKDRYTSGHSQRVAKTSVAIAKELGMSEDSIEKIRLAGLIHDVGKIGVGESVLNKPGALSNEEFQYIKRHPEIGEHILSPFVADMDILKAVRHHHERYDGTGYPDGLSGEQIPLGARILAVADTFDAMTADRSYQAAMSKEEALGEIRQCSYTQFDPVVANILLGLAVHKTVWESESSMQPMLNSSPKNIECKSQ